MSGHDWSIDTIVHALPSPDMRQQALREVHLAPLDELQEVVARWRAVAVRWVEVETPRIEEARALHTATGRHFAEGSRYWGRFELAAKASMPMGLSWSSKSRLTRPSTSTGSQGYVRAEFTRTCGSVKCTYAASA
ncbi:hypothetical protein [Streptomyces sp. NPDC058385]|uniref:hypothetical protein n=1 Tax=Streptomyces sp. NPDC058385 TaxID=3346473 RepID=UPI0036551DC8